VSQVVKLLHPPLPRPRQQGGGRTIEQQPGADRSLHASPAAGRDAICTCLLAGADNSSVLTTAGSLAANHDMCARPLTTPRPFPATQSTRHQERGRVLYRLADLIEQHADELAALETLVRRASAEQPFLAATTSCCPARC
jgi:hypothetical protein